MATYQHYWIMPLVAAACWWAMLIAYLAIWAAQGKPIYEFMNETDLNMIFLSDIAASGNIQPIFISLAGAQGLLFVLSLCVEMYLRDTRQLRPGAENRKHVRNSMIAAIICGIIGQLGILFVSIFNTRVFHHVHESMLVIFIVFVAISSLSSVAEYASLDKDYKLKRHVIVSLVARVIWFAVELGFAIAFGCLRNINKSRQADMEWCLCFVYPLYMFIMAWDLWPAYNKSKGHYPAGDETPYDPNAPLGDAYAHPQDEAKLVSEF